MNTIDGYYTIEADLSQGCWPSIK